MKIHELLEELKACDEAQKWSKDKTWEQIYNQCHRGDWLCWLFVRTNPDDIRLLTLVKGHQANTVRHLMTNQRSLDAVDAAIAFGEGRISLDELKKTAYADYTDHASYAAYTSVAYSTSYADYTASNAADAYAADAAKKKNRKETADIFRKFIPINKFNI